LLGDFTAKKILAPGWLKTWDPHSGRFRHFLATSLINFVWDWWRRQPGYKDWEDRQKEEWRRHRYFAAFNRAEDLCNVIVVGGSGAVVADFQFADSAEGWKAFDRTMQTFPQCAIAIDSSCSAPERLLKRDYPLYQPDPKQAKAFGSHLLAFAKEFCCDGCAWRALRPPRDSGTVPPAPSPAHEAGPDLDLARVILAQTLDRVERDCKDPKRPQPRYEQIWEVFRLRTLDPIFESAKAPSHEELIKILNIPLDSDPAFMLWTAKSMFSEHLTDIVKEYQETGRATESELAVVAGFLKRLERKKAEKKAKKERKRF